MHYFPVKTNHLRPMRLLLTLFYTLGCAQGFLHSTLPHRLEASHLSSQRRAWASNCGKKFLSRVTRSKSSTTLQMQLPPELISVDLTLGGLTTSGLITGGLGGTVGFVLGLLGGGGSILALPIFLYVLNEPAQSAIAESLLVVSIGAGVGLLAKLKSVDVREILPLASSAMMGSFSMAQYSKAVPESWRLGLFTVFCVTSSVNMIQSAKGNSGSSNQAKSVRADSQEDTSPTATGAKATHPSLALSQELNAIGTADQRAAELPPIANQLLSPSVSNQAQLLGLLFLVGCLTSLIGAGGGFIVVPILTLFAGIPIESAVGSSLLIICLNALSGFASMQGVVEVHYDVVVPFAGAVSVGALLGSAQAERISQAALKQLFGSMVLLGCGGVLAMKLPAVLAKLH